MSTAERVPEGVATEDERSRPPPSAEFSSAREVFDALRRGLAQGALGQGRRVLRLAGHQGSLGALTIAQVARSVAPAQRPLVVLVAGEARALELTRDVGQFLAAATGGPVGGGEPAAPGAAAAASTPAFTLPPVLHLPAVETSPYADVSPDRRVILRRQATLFRLSQGFAGEVLICSASAYARKVIPRSPFARLVDLLATGEELDRDATLRRLIAAGFQRTPVVEDPGTFAIRGSVLDLFVPLYRFPVRLELAYDRVESIRLFDPATQRGLRSVDEVYVFPVRETVRTEGAEPRAKLLEAADAAAHPSAKTRALLEQVDTGDDFFGVEQLAPAFHARMAPLDDYLPPDATFFIEEPEAVLDAVADDERLWHAQFTERREERRVVFRPEDFALPADAVASRLAAVRRVESRALHFDTLQAQEPPLRVALEANGDVAAELRRARAERGEEMLRPLTLRLRQWLQDGWRVTVVAPNPSHAERLVSLLRGHGLTPVWVDGASPRTKGDRPAGESRSQGGPGGAAPLAWDPLQAPAGALEIRVGSLVEGVRLPRDGVVVLTEDEIFGPRVHRRSSPRAAAKGFSLGELKDLKLGDYVVHSEHGIGIYRGLTKLAPTRGLSLDFLQIEYDGGSLYVPVYRLSVVQRYVGAEGQRPKLDKMGGESWRKTSARVRREVKQLAEQLLQLYAQRQALPGFGYPSADELFQEFEATFPFEETPDQQKAIDEVIADMEAPHPMDRLVCGDVGYGKTEVAVRAAFKAVCGGKQVAVLAPTTVLVEQHARTFADRFRNYPVRVASLSRFRSRAEQLAVVKRIANREVDVVVGTHRLLSKDIRWKDLGLVIIDEEQRFGVAHKERLKQFKTQVDVLTLTATPIPRTLHLAMMGLREMSIITTPPVDRLAIRTLVARWDGEQIRDAIVRELGRGGQCFYVHNRVEDIEEEAGRLRALLPELRIGIGHGQMAQGRLEEVMLKFVDHQLDVLVCTTIIESGLDIPRANTMFVNRADCFGLAQLYQLRGRIGRSRERAYCYLLVPPEGAMTTEAKARLAVLQRFTELGAGFQIASHDLELRGAGDFLGDRQSGEIAAVGFETYVKLLEEAVAELRGEEIQRERDPELTSDLPGFIPDDYLDDIGQRLDFYKRLGSAEHDEEIAALVEELQDRYGPAPEEVKLLAGLMGLKAVARRLRATAVDLSGARLTLTLAEDTALVPQQVLKLVGVRNSPYRLTPDMRLLCTLRAERKDEELGEDPHERLAAARRSLNGLCAVAEGA
jgi:transcription-repair coupling factor (superfamily II helicase)